jgi:hypothetical protein
MFKLQTESAFRAKRAPEIIRLEIGVNRHREPKENVRGCKTQTSVRV